MSASGFIGDNPLFAADAVVRFLRVALLVAVWRTILGDGGGFGGLSARDVLTYTLVANVFAEQLQPETRLPSDLWDGTIGSRFLRPMSVFGQYVAEVAGAWTFSFLVVAVPLVVLAGPLLGLDPRPHSAHAAAWFVLSLIAAVAVGLAIDLAFGALMIHLEQNWYAAHLLRRSAWALLSGAVIPLAAFPWGIGRVLEWLPFAATASAPLTIYVGAGDPVRLVALQAAWAALLWPVAALLWKVNRQRLVLHGG